MCQRERCYTIYMTQACSFDCLDPELLKCLVCVVFAHKFLEEVGQQIFLHIDRVRAREAPTFLQAC